MEKLDNIALACGDLCGTPERYRLVFLSPENIRYLCLGSGG